MNEEGRLASIEEWRKRVDSILDTFRVRGEQPLPWYFPEGAAIVKAESYDPAKQKYSGGIVDSYGTMKPYSTGSVQFTVPNEDVPGSAIGKTFEVERDYKGGIVATSEVGATKSTSDLLCSTATIDSIRRTSSAGPAPPYSYSVLGSGRVEKEWNYVSPGASIVKRVRGWARFDFGTAMAGATVTLQVSIQTILKSWDPSHEWNHIRDDELDIYVLKNTLGALSANEETWNALVDYSDYHVADWSRFNPGGTVTFTFANVVLDASGGAEIGIGDIGSSESTDYDPLSYFTFTACAIAWRSSCSACLDKIKDGLDSALDEIFEADPFLKAVPVGDGTKFRSVPGSEFMESVLGLAPARGAAIIGDATGEWAVYAKQSEGKVLRYTASDLVASTATFPDTVSEEGRFLRASASNTWAESAWTIPDTITAGDLIYGADSNVAETLPGNITTTRKFLRQVGDGTNSAAPEWDTLLTSDIPDLSATYAVVGHNHAGVYQPLNATLTSIAGLSHASGVLTNDGAGNLSWGAGGSAAHNFLSATHSDTDAAAVQRGDLIAGLGATPKWSRLAKGNQGTFLQMGADEPAWFDLFGTANTWTATQTIANTAPSLVLTDTTASAKSLTMTVDGNVVDFRESSGAAGSFITYDLANLRVGVGVSSPSAILHLRDDSAAPLIYLDTSRNSAFQNVQIRGYVYSGSNNPAGTINCGYTARGSRASPSSLSANDRLFQIGGYAWNSGTSAFATDLNAGFRVYASGNHGSNSLPTALEFLATASGAASPSTIATWDTATFVCATNITVANGKYFGALTDGSGGGYYAGASSDVQLYRGAANTWYTGSGDSLYVQGATLGVGIAPSSAIGCYVVNGTAGGYFIVSDSGTNNAVTGIAYRHTSSGSAAANFGVDLVGQLSNASATLKSPFLLRTAWIDATNGGEEAAQRFYSMGNGTATLALEIASQATTNFHNFAFVQANASPNYQSMVGGLYLGNCSAAPSGNPSGGAFIYVESGAAKCRGSGGTITTFGPAGPRCGKCGYDFWRVVAETDRFGGAYIRECAWCGTVYRKGLLSILHLLTVEDRRELIYQEEEEGIQC